VQSLIPERTFCTGPAEVLDFGARKFRYRHPDAVYQHAADCSCSSGHHSAMSSTVLAWHAHLVGNHRTRAKIDSFIALTSQTDSLVPRPRCSRSSPSKPRPSGFQAEAKSIRRRLCWCPRRVRRQLRGRDGCRRQSVLAARHFSTVDTFSHPARRLMHVEHLHHALRLGLLGSPETKGLGSPGSLLIHPRLGTEQLTAHLRDDSQCLPTQWSRGEMPESRENPTTHGLALRNTLMGWRKRHGGGMS
jgi:hypothetical protein